MDIIKLSKQQNNDKPYFTYKDFKLVFSGSNIGAAREISGTIRKIQKFYYLDFKISEEVRIMNWDNLEIQGLRLNDNSYVTLFTSKDLFNQEISIDTPDDDREKSFKFKIGYNTLILGTDLNFSIKSNFDSTKRSTLLIKKLIKYIYDGQY